MVTRGVLELLEMLQHNLRHLGVQMSVTRNPLDLGHLDSLTESKWRSLDRLGELDVLAEDAELCAEGISADLFAPCHPEFM
jgi:hypothetical protein